MKRFIGYPSQPEILDHSIADVPRLAHNIVADIEVNTWKAFQGFGNSINDEVRIWIDEADVCFFDVTHLNNNVFFEAGYALGKGKAVVPIVNSGVEGAGKYLNVLGLFDSHLQMRYENSEQLAEAVAGYDAKSFLKPHFSQIDASQPLFVQDSLKRTEFASKVISAIKASRTFFKSYDPTESYRLTVSDAVKYTSASTATLVTFLPNTVHDFVFHNLKASYLAGLALGQSRATMILQYLSGTDAPLDYRDLVRPIRHPDEIYDYISEFASIATSRLQSTPKHSKPVGRSSLSKISLGASAAENEFRRLEEYFIETHEFHRALRGEGRLVVGRKGTGKTAIFWQVRDRLRENKANLVLDLKPDGYQLRKFKEGVLGLLSEGSKEHTVSAFWEALLYREIVHKIVEDDISKYSRDPKKIEPFEILKQIDSEVKTASSGDFSERMLHLITEISERAEKDGSNNKRLPLQRDKITEIVYSIDINVLRSAVHKYLRFKERVVILFDNIDKGWGARGVTDDDTLIVRSLMESLRKIERYAQREGFDFSALIFLRNDVYELLIDNTPDRGKEALIRIDWQDKQLLKNVLNARLEQSLGIEKEKVWGRVACAHVDGEASDEFLMRRCLMRPRALLELADRCIGHAVSLDHDQVEKSDFVEGFDIFSNDLLADIDLEIRDVNKASFGAIYGLIGLGQREARAAIEGALIEVGVNDDDVGFSIDLLIWFGVLGVVDARGVSKYIYDVRYNMKTLNAIIERQKEDLIYSINPAFHAALGTINLI